MKKQVIASILLACCAYYPVAAQKVQQKLPQSHKAVTPQKSNDNLPNESAQEFCANYVAYLGQLPAQYRLNASSSLKEAGLVLTEDSPIVQQLLYNSRLREAAYRSLYDYYTEVQFLYGNRPIETLLFNVLHGSLQMSDKASQLVTAHIIARYQPKTSSSSNKPTPKSIAPSLPSWVAGEFCAQYNKYFNHLDAQYCTNAQYSLVRAGFIGAPPAPLAWELAKSETLREVAYKSIYTYEYEYTIKTFKSTATPRELVFKVLSSDLHMKEEAAKILTQHIITRYHHPEPGASNVASTNASGAEDAQQSTGNGPDGKNAKEEEPADPTQRKTAEFGTRSGEYYNVEGVNTPLDKMPELSGNSSITAIATAVQKAVRYPDKALADEIQGIVTVRFVVTAQGTVTAVAVVKGVNGLNDEAVRAVKTLPSFTPGRYKGDPVSAVLTIPVTFRIQ